MSSVAVQLTVEGENISDRTGEPVWSLMFSQTSPYLWSRFREYLTPVSSSVSHNVSVTVRTASSPLLMKNIVSFLMFSDLTIHKFLYNIYAYLQRPDSFCVSLLKISRYLANKELVESLTHLRKPFSCEFMNRSGVVPDPLHCTLYLFITMSASGMRGFEHRVVGSL